jgi:ubiquinone/menaquinone biosynthesis C-methylase UbiE
MTFTDSEKLKNDQYRNVNNLQARIRLHERFSTSKVELFHWVFDHLLAAMPAQATLLEIGSGRGDLWKKNLNRIPSGWHIRLTDFSPGMLADCRSHLGEGASRFEFATVDAQAIPYDNAQFDAVIANFMLDHVANRPEAIREFRRVLKPGGKLFAMTVGENHLIELMDILHQFTPEAPLDFRVLGFTVQNGAEQLRLGFSDVRFEPFPDSLYVTELQPLLDYVASSTTLWKDNLSAHPDTQRFIADLEARIKREGGIHIQKESGLFIASG